MSHAEPQVKTRSVQVLEEVLRDIGLVDADRARLRGLAPKLAPELGEIAAQLAARVETHPPAAEALRDPAVGDRLRRGLVGWMQSGLSGPYDDEFCRRRAELRREHAALGLPRHFALIAASTLRSEYAARIDRLYEPPEAQRVTAAAHKLVDAELALLLRHAQLDGEARRAARAVSAHAERVAALQTLSSGLAHELRNPLNAAKLQLELLERRLRRDREREDPKLLEPVVVVQLEIERLTRLVAEFLAFARPVALLVGDHDVAAIVDDVLASHRGSAPSIAIERTGAASLIACVDADKLRQIVHNLVHNALEAMAPGGRLTVALAGDADRVELAVGDTGPGIPPAILHRIYEPFFSTKELGTGLGLSIVHSAVTLHGGTIHVESRPGETRVRVVLPRATRAGCAASTPSSRGPASAE